MPTEPPVVPSAAQPRPARRRRRQSSPGLAPVPNTSVAGAAPRSTASSTAGSADSPAAGHGHTAGSTDSPTFASLGVPAPLVAVLAGTGITVPFPIQAATLPDALAGRDILGRAQTGSGKTLGFSLPLVARLSDGYTMACRPRGLVLVPTRELATQVQKVLAPLARAAGLSVATIFGGYVAESAGGLPCVVARTSSSPAQDGWLTSSSRVTATLATWRSPFLTRRTHGRPRLPPGRQAAARRHPA